MIAWFARNGVAANLLMAVILVTGIHAVHPRIPLEVFPSFELDIITISVPFRGATPEDVEEAVVTASRRPSSTWRASRRCAPAPAKASRGGDRGGGLGLRTAQTCSTTSRTGWTRISTFPAETERPVYSLATRQREVISVGDLRGSVRARACASTASGCVTTSRRCPASPRWSWSAVRPYEIAIEVSENALHQYGLTFDDVVAAIRRASLDLSAGSIRTSGGEILLRTKGQAYVDDDFARIQILSRADGTRLTLGDIATVRDGFEENPVRAQLQR